MTDHQPLTLIMQEATLSPAQTRWVRLGFFQSIQPIIVYQAWKGECVSGCIVKEQKGGARCSQLHDSRRWSNQGNFIDESEFDCGHRRSLHLEDSARGRPVVQDTIQRMRQWQVKSVFVLNPQGLLVQEDDGQRKLIVLTSMRQKLMASCLDKPSKGHLGVHKTTKQVKRQYWWKGMAKDIENYVKSCPVCQVMKSDHKKKVGPLQSIPVPIRKWEQITTDMVTNLPPSARYIAIAIFVYRLTKMVHFAPCTKEISANQHA